MPTATGHTSAIRAGKAIGTDVYDLVSLVRYRGEPYPKIVERVQNLTSHPGLRPFVDPLEPTERKEFLREYTARVAAAYLPQADGKVLLRFPRLFVVAVRN